ncbi:MAG: transporter, partial [Ignavibacteriales bacterium]|nr:transporter [Ignavibacteriales bacterium]
MNFLQTLFSTPGTASTLLFISMAAFLGIVIGKIEIKNIKLGIAGVLFSGLAIAHLGARPEVETLHFVREFGL